MLHISTCVPLTKWIGAQALEWIFSQKYAGSGPLPLNALWMLQAWMVIEAWERQGNPLTLYCALSTHSHKAASTADQAPRPCINNAVLTDTKIKKDLQHWHMQVTYNDDADGLDTYSRLSFMGKDMSPMLNAKGRAYRYLKKPLWCLHIMLLKWVCTWGNYGHKRNCAQETPLVKLAYHWMSTTLPMCNHTLLAASFWYFDPWMTIVCTCPSCTAVSLGASAAFLLLLLLSILTP